MRVTLGGAEVDLVGRGEVLSTILERLGRSDDGPLCVTSASLEHLHHFGADSGRQGVLDRSRSGEWIVLPDGPPVLWAARRLTGRTLEAVPAVGLVPDVLSAVEASGVRVGFMVGENTDATEIGTLLRRRHPELDLAAVWTVTTDDSLSADEIAQSGIDLLIVDLPKPTAELWLVEHGHAAGVKVAITTGQWADLKELARGEVRAKELPEPPGAGRRLAKRVIERPLDLVRLVSHSTRAEARGAPLGLATPARWRLRLGRFLVLTDALVIGLSSWGSYLLRDLLGRIGVVEPFQDEVAVALAVLPLWLGVLYLTGSYEPHHLYSGRESVRRFAAGAVGGLLLLAFVSYAWRLELSRVYVSTLFVSVFVLGLLARLGVRGYLHRQRARGRFIQNAIVVGTDRDALEAAQAMQRTTIAGYRVVGFVDDDRDIGEPVTDGTHVIGRTDEILGLAYRYRAGLVVVSPSGVRPGTLREVTLTLEGSPVDLAVAPSLFQVVTQRVTVEAVDNVPMLHVSQIRLEGSRAAVKRTVDVLVAAVLLVLTAPVFIVSALAIRLESSGPVFFRQARVGKDGCRFTMLKFRTMVEDAEHRLEQVLALNEARGHFFKIAQDPRVTGVGRVLRRWSIDELPQLINVLRGDMSLVGPRPPLPREVENYEPWHLRRLRVRPGLTGVWQVSGRADVPFEEAVRMDLFYIENWSLGYDLVIIARTLGAILRRTGAY